MIDPRSIGFSCQNCIQVNEPAVALSLEEKKAKKKPKEVELKKKASGSAREESDTKAAGKAKPKKNEKFYEMLHKQNLVRQDGVEAGE